MTRRPRLHIVAVAGGPTRDEQVALGQVVEHLVEQDHRARSSSTWLRASRSQGRRLGMLDYRDRFTPEDAWRLSTRFPFGGREYPGLVGRGDAR